LKVLDAIRGIARRFRLTREELRRAHSTKDAPAPRKRPGMRSHCPRRPEQNPSAGKKRARDKRA
jgi:hypothetical protein